MLLNVEELKENMVVQFENIRKGKVKEIAEFLKEQGLLAIDGLANFFKSVTAAIKEFGKNVVGDEYKSSMKFLKTIKDNIILYLTNAVKTALGMIKALFKKPLDTLDTLDINVAYLNDGSTIKAHTILGIGLIGALVILGIYKIVEKIKSLSTEKEPTEMEESINATIEAFDKTNMFFDGLQEIALKEDFVDHVSDKIKSIIDKAYFVTNDVVNFVDPNIDVVEGESKLVKLFKSMLPISLAVMVAGGVVVVSKKVLSKPVEAA